MELIAIDSEKNNDIVTKLSEINKPLELFVAANKLPTENVLASNDEKAKLFKNFSDSISSLPDSVKEKSDYLTKFIIAGAVGLFDGALNFLWDEIVRSLRNKAINYDIVYFYSIAEQVNSQYKKLSTIEEIECISDYDLLVILKRIGILDEFAFKTLENISYLRNHASAAHPNVNELTGIKLASLLEDGIKYSILLETNNSSIQVKQLFNNIISVEIPSSDFEMIANELCKIEKDRLDDFFISIFGVYCDLKSKDFVIRNILEISKGIWIYVSEDCRHKAGSKFGYYRVNGAVEQKERVNKLLEYVDGLKYKDEDSIVADLIDKLSVLNSAHHAINNFYNEYPYARDIKTSLGDKNIPSPIRKIFVKTICVCYAGNGNGYREGIDESAVVLYNEMIEKFGNDEIKDFILLFQDDDFTVDFYKSKVIRRVKKLCEILKNKTANIDLISGLDIILNSQDLQKIKILGDYIHLVDKIK